MRRWWHRSWFQQSKTSRKAWIIIKCSGGKCRRWLHKDKFVNWRIVTYDQVHTDSKRPESRGSTT